MAYLIKISILMILGVFAQEGRGCPGVTYIRWGRTDCNADSAELVYKGLAGGASHEYTGSGSNYLCLPEIPEYDEVVAGSSGQERAYVYSAEYQTNTFSPLASLYQHDATCAVCEVSDRSKLLMIPARKTCPEGWIREYHGYLMSNYHSFKSPMEFVCVDRNPEVVPNTASNKNGALFYPAEARCNKGTLPCSSSAYIDGNELSCVVCTK